MSAESDRLIPSPEALNATLLDRAWQSFQLYDYHAIRTQTRFLSLRVWTLRFGVIAVFLSIGESNLKSWIKESGHLTKTCEVEDIFCRLMRGFCEYFPPILHGLVILIPIIITVFLAGAVKFDRGTSWVILRSGAEAIKGEIYRYRCRVYHYKKPETRDDNFAHSLQQICERLMKTQVNQVGIDYGDKSNSFVEGISKQDSDPCSSINAEQYIEFRVIDQLNFYRSKIKKIYRETQRLYWSVYILGGVSAFLAAIDLGIWIAITTTASTAIVSYIAIRQLDNTLINYNQAATNLDNLLVWWDSLSPTARANFDNFEKLVNNAENILGAEVSGWVQEMQNALADLYKEERNKISENASEEQREILSKTLAIEDRRMAEKPMTVEDRSPDDEEKNP